MHSGRNRLRIIEELYKPLLLRPNQFRYQRHYLRLSVSRKLVVANPSKNSVNLLPTLTPDVDSLMNQHSSSNFEFRFQQRKELFAHNLNSRDRQVSRLLRRPPIGKEVQNVRVL